MVTQIDEDISERNVRLWHTIIILIILFVIIVTVIVVSLAIVCRYYRLVIFPTGAVADLFKANLVHDATCACGLKTESVEHYLL